MTAAGFWARLVRGTARIRQRADWSRFAGDNYLATIMTVPTTDRFHAKQGRSTGRWVLRAGDEQLIVYLKRHYRLPWRERVLAWLWPNGDWSPAMSEWTHLEWAKHQGIPVPEPVVAGELLGPGLRLQSFLALEELTGMLALNEALPPTLEELSLENFDRWKRSLIPEMARLVRLLHGARRYHKDLYLCHFYVQPPTADAALLRSPTMYLIDLHRLGHHRWMGWRWQIKDLAQLLYSTFAVPSVTDRDRWRFFRAYCGNGRIDRRLLRSVIAKANRYRKHNASKPTPWESAIQPPTPKASAWKGRLPHQRERQGVSP